MRSDVFRLLFHKQVKSDVKGIPKKMMERILEVLDKLEEDPFSVPYEILKGYRRMYRVRVGDYRVVFSVNFSERTVTIFGILHREKAYEKLKRRAGV